MPVEIINKTGTAQYLACNGEVVEDGESTKVGQDDADSLVAQGTGWTPKNKPTPAKPKE